MTKEVQRRIDECIKYLTFHGYEVKKVREVETYVGKWIAYRREGMEPILHGKVIGDYGCITVKKKKGNRDFCSRDDILKVFDNKQECYAFK